MKLKNFDNPYYATIDRVSRILSPSTIYKILTQRGYTSFLTVRPDILIAACIIVSLHRISQSSIALFAFGRLNQEITKKNYD